MQHVQFFRRNVLQRVNSQQLTLTHAGSDHKFLAAAFGTLIANFGGGSGSTGAVQGLVVSLVVSSAWERFRHNRLVNCSL